MRRAREHLDRLEVRFGKGLVGMRDEKSGKISGHKLTWGKKGGKKYGLLNSDISVTLPGTDITIDAGTTAANFMGIIKGMDYTGVNGENQYGLQQDPITNCFAMSYAMVEASDNLAFDFNNINGFSGEFRWFNTFISDPIKYVADASVMGEMCDIDQFTNKFLNVASLDYSNMSELGVNATVFSFVDLQNYLREFDDLYIPAACPTEIIDTVQEEAEKIAENDDDFNFDEF